MLGAAASEILAACNLSDTVILHNRNWSEGMGSSVRAVVRDLDPIAVHLENALQEGPKARLIVNHQHTSSQVDHALKCSRVSKSEKRALSKNPVRRLRELSESAVLSDNGRRGAERCAPTLSSEASTLPRVSPR